MRGFKAGDVVKIRPQWQDPGDDSIDWICLEDEDGGRVLIEAQVSMRIKPTQRVGTEMIEHRFTARCADIP